jgi:DNA processing protein
MGWCNACSFSLTLPDIFIAFCAVRCRNRYPQTVTSELPYFLAFSGIKGVGPARLRKLIAHFGSLSAAWRAGPFDLARSGLDDKSVGAVFAAQKRVDPAAEMRRVAQAGLSALCWDDPAYPAMLRQVADPPPVLFVRGNLSEADMLAVAIVGTRKATTYGREVSAVLAGELARNGVTVVSGLARGIDFYAHQAALDAGGRTIAVLACGADQVYPAEHARLAARIVATGAVVSDYPVGSAPEAGNFPPRNRIISGLSLGTVVVEADVRSGALITASFAAEQGRDVFAVPGNIFNPSSRGTNQLIANGATPVVDAASLLQQLNLHSVVERVGAGTAVEAAAPQSDPERHVLRHLSHEPTPVDELVRAVEMPAEAVVGLLALLELRGLVQQAGLAGYALARAMRARSGCRDPET